MIVLPFGIVDKHSLSGFALGFLNEMFPKFKGFSFKHFCLKGQINTQVQDLT